MSTQRPLYQSAHTEGQINSLNRKLIRLHSQQLDALRKWRSTYTTSQQLVSALDNLLPRFHALLSTSSPSTSISASDGKPPLKLIPTQGYSLPTSIDSSSLHHSAATAGVVAFIPGLAQQLRARALDELSLIIASLRSSCTTMESYAADCASCATQADAEYRDTTIPHTEAILLLWGRTKDTPRDSRAKEDVAGGDDSEEEMEAVSAVPPDADEDTGLPPTHKDRISRNVWQTVPIATALQALTTTARVAARVTAQLGALVEQAATTLATTLPAHQAAAIVTVHNTARPVDSRTALQPVAESIGAPASPWALEMLCEAWGACGHDMVDRLIGGAAVAPLGR